MEHLTICCPWCEGEIEIIDQTSQQTCPHCGEQVDTPAVLCFLRGNDAFVAGVEAMPAGPKQQRSHVLSPEQMQCYMQAYTAMQEAMKGCLSPGQRQTAIVMMADLSRIFADRLMTSPLEADYWAKLATQQNARREYQAVRGKLADSPRAGLLGAVRRWRWQARCRQLAGALARLDLQVQRMEHAIGFEYARPGLREPQ